jgi:hypothetical protein
VSVWRLAQTIVLLGVLVWTTPSLSADVEGPCGTKRADWRQAYELLKAGAEGYRKIKSESITPLIEKEIAEKGTSKSTAAMVRSVLDNRTFRMTESREKLDKLLVEEKRRFDQLRRCVSHSRRRSRRRSRNDSEERARARVVSRLSDLLLDEAYEQYKNDRPRSVSRSDSSGPSPWERYRGEEAPGWRTGYYGGFGRAPQRYPMPRYPYQGYFRR